MGTVKKDKNRHGDTSSDTAVSLKKGDFNTPSVNPFFQTNTISAGSIVFSVAIPVACFILKAPYELTAVTAFMCVLAIYKHRSNIERLRAGTENKFIKKKD